MTPLRLCPANPHYLEFRGRPVLLITSGEHYGAVLNLDFNYGRYLDELQSWGFNLTRTFSGTYRELPGSFRIENNTLAPAPGRFICPWARSETPGYSAGGNKFDLHRWDEDYFRRLRDFVDQAGRRGIVVELVLFCYFYSDELWAASPMNAASNVNGVGAVPRAAVYTLKHPDLLRVQEAVVRRIADALRDCDNVYYEIINEPYVAWGTDAFQEWQRHMIEVLAAADAGRHLIAQNIANRTARIVEPHPAVSIFNFHYAESSAVGDNYHLNRVIADDETGFKGQAMAPYRKEAWGVVLAGAGIFSHLDYSFTCAHPDGTAPVTGETPGFGGRAWRRQLAVLREFMQGFDLPRLRPAGEVLPGHWPQTFAPYALADPGRAWAIYLNGGAPTARVRLALPPGRYRAEWLHPARGEVLGVEEFEQREGLRLLVSPEYEDDVALRVLAR